LAAKQKQGILSSNVSFMSASELKSGKFEKEDIKEKGGTSEPRFEKKRGKIFFTTCGNCERREKGKHRPPLGIPMQEERNEVDGVRSRKGERRPTGRLT